jgi:hypothetical protein
MNQITPISSPHRRDPLSIVALIVAFIALVISMAGGAPAKQGGGEGARAQDSRHHRKKRTKLAKLKVSCPIPDAVDLGTWCLESSPHPIPPRDIGKNDFVYAAKACVRDGGWLPSAAQLLGAAARAKLESTIDDNPTTAATDEFQSAKNGGIKDKREMTSDLFTTTAGSDAAGSEGVTVGSKGNLAVGEPDPTPMPAVPMPDTLDYVTVYDNHNQGGFAGGEPVGTAENFRCAYAKGSQGQKFGD